MRVVEFDALPGVTDEILVLVNYQSTTADYCSRRLTLWEWCISALRECHALIL